MKKNKVLSWCLYDWGNSAFAATVMAAVLPVYYYDVAAEGLDPNLATSYWGYSQSLAVLVVALLSPILGAIADFSGAKKRFLRIFASLGMLSSFLMAFIGTGDYVFASVLMILGTIGFSGGNVFYDALLPDVASRQEMDRVSAKGFAFGYLGGGVLLTINLLMIMNPHWFSIANAQLATQISFASVGVWWFAFSLPLFRNVDERRVAKSVSDQSYLRIAFKRLRNTYKEIHHYKQLFIFLIAFWMYNDGISTIIKMATIYGRDIGIDGNDLIAALLITQFVGFPCSFLFGWLAVKINAKRALMLSLWVYVIIVIFGYFMNTAAHFYLLAITVGVVQGGAQALSRSIFGRMVPRHKEAEFFGFYGVSSKFSAIFGPFVFAAVGQLTGSSRLGIVSLLIFFLAGLFLLNKVDIEVGEREARRLEV